LQWVDRPPAGERFSSPVDLTGLFILRDLTGQFGTSSKLAAYRESAKAERSPVFGHGKPPILNIRPGAKNYSLLKCAFMFCGYRTRSPVSGS